MDSGGHGGDMVESTAPSSGKKADTQARYRQRQKVTVTARNMAESVCSDSCRSKLSYSVSLVLLTVLSRPATRHHALGSETSTATASLLVHA